MASLLPAVMRSVDTEAVKSLVERCAGVLHDSVPGIEKRIIKELLQKVHRPPVTQPDTLYTFKYVSRN